jgi:uncharacterized protein (DUF1697 family)
MITYISILRGINVSGQRLIKMDSLQKMYEKMGFQCVKTYIQSGNVIFKHKDCKTEELEEIITKQIEKDYGFSVPVIVITIDKLKKIIENNPFSKDATKDAAFMHVTFLSSKPKVYAPDVIEAKKANNEEIVFSEEAIYLYCPNGYGKTKLSNNFIENKLKVGATTRNWKSTQELLKIAQTIFSQS